MQDQQQLVQTPKSVSCPCNSGKPFAECHGAVPVIASPMIVSSPVVTRKLDLACGQNCREGFEGCDLPGVPGTKHAFNLLRFPWPFEDSSVAELNCSHFIEHIPMEYVQPDGTYCGDGELNAQDLFFRFFDECHRILIPGGFMDIVVPCARNNRAFQDPTHRRFIVAETFFYLSKKWRADNKLDHYNVRCDFDGNVIFTVPTELNLKPAEVQQQKFNESWNAIVDWVAKLKAVK